jgi:predicted nucleic acid-binding protein
MKEVEHVTGQARFAKALSPDDRKDLLEFVKNLADFREQTHFPTPSKDADDNMYLGLAMQVGAQQIVTNDTDLRELKHYLGIQIWSPEQFIARESTLEAEKGQ